MSELDSADLITIAVFVILVIWLCYRNKEQLVGTPTMRDQLVNTARSKMQDKKGMAVNDYLLEQSLQSGVGLPYRFSIR